MTTNFLPQTTFSNNGQTTAIETVPAQPQEPMPSNLEVALGVQRIAAEMTLLALGGAVAASAVTGGVMYGVKKWQEHRRTQSTPKPPAP